MLQRSSDYEHRYADEQTGASAGRLPSPIVDLREMARILIRRWKVAAIAPGVLIALFQSFSARTQRSDGHSVQGAWTNCP